MTPALRLLWALRDRGVRLWVEDGHLQYDAPIGVITTEDGARIPEVKADLLRLLVEPCPCGPCSQGEDPHGPRCYCPACLDADPKWEAWRAEIAEDDRYAAEERLSIQQEACTPAELEALKIASSPAPKSERWINPDLGPDDLALLRACERLDRQLAVEAAECAVQRTKEGA